MNVFQPRLWIMILCLSVLAGCGQEESQTTSEPTVTPKPVVHAPTSKTETGTESLTAQPKLSGSPSPTPGIATYFLYARSVEMITDEAGIQEYKKKIDGRSAVNWVGRVHKILDDPTGGKLVMMEMNYKNTTPASEVPDLALKGLSENVLGEIEKGMILNFSGKIKTLEDIGERKNAFVVEQVRIFGLGK